MNLYYFAHSSYAEFFSHLSPSSTHVFNCFFFDFLILLDLKKKSKLN